MPVTHTHVNQNTLASPLNRPRCRWNHGLVDKNAANSKQTGTITTQTYQLNKRILGANSWDDVVGVLEEARDVVNATNLTAAFHRLNQLKSPTFHDFQDQRIVRILTMTKDLLKNYPQQFGSSHCSVITHSMAQKDFQRVPQGMELFDTLIKHAKSIIQEFTNPKHMCLLLWSINKIDAPLHEVFVDAAPLVVAQIPKYSTYDLSVIAWSYASYHDVLDRRTCKQISVALGQEGINRSSSFSPKEFALLGWGCSLLGHTPKKFLPETLEFLKPRLKECSYSDLSLFVVTLGRLGINVYHADSMKKIMEEIRVRFAFHPQWGWRSGSHSQNNAEEGTPDKRQDPLRKLVWNDPTPPLEKLDDDSYWPCIEELPRTVAGLQSLSRFDSSVNVQPVLESVFYALSAYQDQFGVEELSSMLHGLSAGRVFAPELFSLFRKRVPEVLVQTPKSSISPQHISEILWAFAHSGIPATRMFLASSPHLLKLTPSMDFKQAALSLASMQISRFWKPDVCRALVVRLLEIAPEGMEPINPDETQTFGRFALDNGEMMFIPRGVSQPESDISQVHAFIMRMLHRALLDIVQTKSHSEAAVLLKSKPELLKSCEMAEENMPWHVTGFRAKLVSAASHFLEKGVDVEYGIDGIKEQINSGGSGGYTESIDQGLCVPKAKRLMVAHWIPEAGVRVDVAFPERKVAILGVHAGQCAPMNTVSREALEQVLEKTRMKRPGVSTVYDIRDAVANGRGQVPSYHSSFLGSSSSDHSGAGVKLTAPRNSEGVMFPMDALPRVSWGVKALRRAGWKVILDLAVLHQSSTQRVKRIQSTLNRSRE